MGYRCVDGRQGEERKGTPGKESVVEAKDKAQETAKAQQFGREDELGRREKPKVETRSRNRDSKRRSLARVFRTGPILVFLRHRAGQGRQRNPRRSRRPSSARRPCLKDSLMGVSTSGFWVDEAQCSAAGSLSGLGTLTPRGGLRQRRPTPQRGMRRTPDGLCQRSAQAKQATA